MSDIGPFPGYFLDDKQYHSRARSVGVCNTMTDRTYSHLRIVRMPSPVQYNCEAHDTIANGQYGAVWSMGHTHNRSPWYNHPPLKRLATVFREICFPEAARN
ncbi:hypothetical protein TNCV_2359601 [Trichonephila clavipes]|nr:hypothetical protein TNCV_2359601 [Trichonephila clavipes]